MIPDARACSTPSAATASWVSRDRRGPGARRRKRGDTLLLLLMILECLACVFIWWRGVVIALGNQPEHRTWDLVQRQRRAGWVRNELERVHGGGSCSAAS